MSRIAADVRYLRSCYVSVVSSLHRPVTAGKPKLRILLLRFGFRILPYSEGLPKPHCGRLHLRLQ